MTEYEFNEILTGSMALILELTAVFISVFVAFIVCAYLVGAKLSKLQSIGISFVYSSFTAFLVFLIYMQLSRIGRLLADYNGLEFTSISVVYLIGPGVIVISWILSIIYMAQVRAEPRANEISENVT